MRNDVQAALRGPLFALFRDDAGGMRLMLEGDRHHFLGRRHLEIERQGDFAHQPGAVGERLAAEHGDRALIGGETEDGIERRGLAGAIVPDKAIDPAGQQLEIEAAEDGATAELLFEAAGGDGRRPRLDDWRVDHGRKAFPAGAVVISDESK